MAESLGERLFRSWAPRTSKWSAWAKPVLFAQMSEAPEPATVEAVDTSWAAQLRDAALIVDLEGPSAVWTGAALLARGFRPVPLFNGSHGVDPLVPTTDLLRALASAAPLLGQADGQESLLPAFLVDARRMNGASELTPGRYDNRWVVVPQDFPSATHLTSADLRRVVLVARRDAPVADDLALVLRRYSDAGLTIERLATEPGAVPQPFTPPRPSFWKARFYRLLVALKFRRNSTGGFGAIVGEPGGSAG